MDFNKDPMQQRQYQSEHLEQRYSILIDKRKIFWIFILITLIFTFIFTSGYWFGSKSTKVAYPVSDNLNFEDQSSMMEDSTNRNTQDLDIEGGEKLSNNMPFNSSNDLSQSPVIQEKVPKKATSNDLETLDKALENDPNKTQKIIPSDTEYDDIISTSTEKDYPTISQKNPPSKKHSFSAVRPKGSYIVQLASIQSLKNALRIKKLLVSKGYYDISIIKMGVLYRLVYGRYSSYQEAKKHQPTLEKITKIHSSLVMKIK